MISAVGLVAAAGCNGNLKYSRAKLAQKARKMFDEQVTPLLNDTCAVCHVSAEGQNFLQPNPDLYTAVLTWPGLVNLSDPVSSRLLAKGAHDGPAWTNDQERIIRTWISLESDLRDVEPIKPVSTVAQQVTEGANTIDLDEVGLDGTTITFNADVLENGIYIADIQVHAGPGGARLVHPLWVAWKNGVAFPDAADSFADLIVELGAGETGPMGAGFFPFVPIAPDSYISMTFEVVEGYTPVELPDAGPITGGCQALPEFLANARGPLANTCAGCHSAGNAASAMNLSRIDSDDPADQQSTCNEVLSRTSLENPATSPIFNAPRPGGAGHPFSFDQAGYDAFTGAVTPWITAEQAAQ
jgi:hypothetical protein